MRLFADRFAIASDGQAIDLATGERVSIATSSAGGVGEQARWTLDCDRAFQLWPRRAARLVDYGRLGEGTRFEAWTGGAHGGGTLVAPGAVDVDCAVEGGQEIEALKELFETTADRPRMISIWSDDELRVRAAVSELCRAARMNGVVPVSGALALHVDVDELDARTWCVVVEPGDDGWQRVTASLLRNPKPHVVLFAGRREMRGVQGVSLAPVTLEKLRDSVRMASSDEQKLRAVDAAASKAAGSYARFCASLWHGRDLTMARDRDRPAGRVAERGAEYRATGAEASAAIVPIGTRRPAAPEIVALGEKLDAAVDGFERGRWATGERTARQAIGSLARRHDWARAARGATALADALVRRGRPSEAMTLLTGAREYLARIDASSQYPELLNRIALVSGVAWTELAELDKASSVLHTISLAAGSREGGTHARLALGRCFFWRGAHEDARRVLSSLVERAPADAVESGITARALLSRTLVALDDAAAAVEMAVEAFEDAAARGAASVTADAASAAAVAHLAVGDLRAVERDIAACVAAARAAHRPMLALKGRLIEAEAARRGGRKTVATALVGRLQRLGAASLPPIVRARVDMLSDLLGASDPGVAVKRRIEATGLAGLAVFAPRSSDTRDRLAAGVGGTLEILSCCQSADDDDAVLARVCAIVRRQLGAAAVAFFSANLRAGTRPELVASDGRVDAAIAERVVAANQLVIPHCVNERIEGGAAVRYGGQGIGALVSRWTPAAPCDRARSEAVLALAAVAAGPALAGAIARRAPVRTDEDFIGISEAMLTVRRAVERAAGAPFAVLIQGESGSGKELIARALHRRSPRRTRPFCALNCAALPEDLVESELFGHARGAFTGAASERTGVFEEAHGGTLFLDEVGELSPRAQAKVLRAIQEGEIRRVGENIARRIDVRIVAATNRDLKHESSVHRFRVDLLYRLDVIHIELPALRDRREDIAPLAEKYWRDACGRVGSKATLSVAATAALARYDWPGNVRELQNVLAALAVASARRGVIPPTALPPAFTAGLAGASLRLEAARRTFEERFVRAALARTGGHRVRAAHELGLSRQGLTKLMTRLGISER